MLQEEKRQRRRERLESLLTAEISRLILEDVKDPGCAGVTVSEVRLGKDFTTAVVLVRARDANRDVTESAIPALNRAASFIRKELGTRLSLRRVPHLTFKPDLGLIHSVKIHLLLNELAEEGGLFSNAYENEE